MNINQAIIVLNPSVAMVVGGAAYDKDGVQVLYDEQAARELVAATEYQRQRAAEYPPMSDYLDGVVKGDQAQIDKYIADCLAVKAKYPKP